MLYDTAPDSEATPGHFRLAAFFDIAETSIARHGIGRRWVRLACIKNSGPIV
jgi:hypothetical protein